MLGFLVARKLLGLLGLGPASDARDVEIAVLRHQLALARQVARPRYTPTVWVPETLSTSCHLLVFVEEAADAVVSLDLADVGRCMVGERP